MTAPFRTLISARLLQKRRCFRSSEVSSFWEVFYRGLLERSSLRSWQELLESKTKIRGKRRIFKSYSNFLFWFQYPLPGKICFSCVVINHVKISLPPSSQKKKTKVRRVELGSSDSQMEHLTTRLPTTG